MKAPATFCNTERLYGNQNQVPLQPLMGAYILAEKGVLRSYIMAKYYEKAGYEDVKVLFLKLFSNNKNCKGSRASSNWKAFHP